jgi:polysaccharide biosynthesis protein PslG
VLLARRSLLLAAALVPALGGVAGGTELRGAQVHPFWEDTRPADYVRELELLRRAGGNTVRIDLSWSSLETAGKGRESRWYVNRADHFLQEAQRQGLKVVATLWSTPCWASSAPPALKQRCRGQWWDRGVDRFGPRRPSDYADAAAWVARRWGSRLAAIEVWNEPDLDFLQAADSALAYTELLRAAYPRIKQAAPRITVLGGVLAGSDGHFLERLYAAGAGGNFDALAIHPYNEWRDPDDPWLPEHRRWSYREGVPWIRSIMEAHGDGGKELWLTEIGFSTCGTGDRWCVGEAAQAEYILDSFRIAREWPYVRAAVVYNLRNKGTDPTDRESQFGLLRRDFTRKPSYSAFRLAMLGFSPPAPTLALGD